MYMLWSQESAVCTVLFNVVLKEMVHCFFLFQFCFLRQQLLYSFWEVMCLCVWGQVLTVVSLCNTWIYDQTTVGDDTFVLKWFLKLLQNMTLGYKTESWNQNYIWMCAFYYKETKASNIPSGTEVICAMYII